MKIFITNQAADDIAAIYGYILDELHNPIAADVVQQLIADKINTLSDMPARGIAVQKFTQRKTDVLFVIVKNYLIFYEIDTKRQAVQVLYVIPAMRDFTKILFGDGQ